MTDASATSPASSQECGDEVALSAALPAPLRTALMTDMHGRADGLAAVAAALAAAVGGSLRVVLVAGEPGVGKTRLAAEAGARAAEAGHAVLYGRCDEDLVIPYRPFAEALRAWVAAARTDTARERQGALAPDVARLVSGFGEGGSSPPPEADAERYLLYGSVARALGSIAGENGALLVLDDLHWADAGTVQMARQLIRAPLRLPLVVLASYRSTELIDDDHPLASLLAALAGRDGVERLSLEGLAEPDASALVADVVGRELDAGEAALAQRLRVETDGNPLYLGEIARDLVERGALAGAARRGQLPSEAIPGTVREVILGRVRRVGPTALRLLGAAAAAGHEFEPALVRSATRASEDELETVLDAATRAALVEPVRRGEGLRFAFTHSLVERAVYEALPAIMRGRLHGALADGLEGRDGATLGRAAELARHRLRAYPPVPDRAIEACAHAGELALAALAPQEALRFYEQAMALQERHLPGNEDLRCRLLVGLGDGQRQCGVPAFRETLLEASRLALGRGDAGRLVHATLANTRGFVSASGVVDEERIAMLEAALEALAPEGGAQRARLLAHLAAERTFDADWRARHRIADEAVQVARQTGDAATLCHVLTVRFVPIWAPETLERRLRDMEEAVALADRLGDPLAQLNALHWRGVALVHAAQLEQAARTVEREAELARRLAQPTALWLATYDQASLATIFGRLEEAERLAGEALELGTGSGQPDAVSFYANQIGHIRYEQGRLGELQPLIAQAVADNPGIPAFRALLALSLCDAELDADAAAVLAADRDAGFEELPHDVTLLAGLAIYAEVAARVRDTQAAAVLYELLSPWADQIAYSGVSAWGSIEYALGRLEATLGRFDDAEQRLQAAVQGYDRMGAPVWAARAAVGAGEALLSRRAGGDASVARRLLEQAQGAARRLGAQGIERRARVLLDRERAHDALAEGRGPLRALPGRAIASPAVQAGEAAPRQPGQPRTALLSREGDLWRFAVEGRSFHVRDSRGLGYLARLLERPHEEASAVELGAGAPRSVAPELAGAVAADGLARVGPDPDSALPALDEEAKRAYRERIVELRQELEEAERFNDPERSERAAAELASVEGELLRAMGRHGRDRPVGATAERARVSVTRAIRRAIASIAAHDPDLGAELHRSVRTGAYCAYDPPRETELGWTVQTGG